MIAIEDKQIRRQLSFVNAIRIAVLSAFLFISLFLLLFDVPFPAVPIIIALVAAFIISLFNFSLYRRLNYRTAVYLQLFADITLVTVLVYFSESYRSPFYFLYILPISVSALFLTRRDTIYIASLSFIVFGVLCNLTYLEVIPFYPTNVEKEISLGNFVYNIAMGFVAFCTVAILFSYYFENIRKTNAALKNVQDNLRDIIQLNTTVMEKMENGLVTSDSNGTIISYNEKAKVMLDISMKQDIFGLLFPGAEAEKIGELRGTEGKNKGRSKDYFEILLGEQTLGISLSILENIYSFDRLLVFIITDLTERRAIEEKLRKQEHLALIGEMSAGIAHEIRNPLASISGSVQFLRRELALESKENKNLMNIIVKESERLSQSIEDFLTFTKTAPLEKTRMDLAALLDDVTGLVELNHKSVNLVKKYSPGYMVHADVKRIKQLFWNVMNNAVKAVNGKGTVELTIYRKDDVVYFSIADNGVGMDEEEQARVFVPFYSHFTSGIGLGMSLVKRIVDEHNFAIKINSQKNIGTEVIVCFKQ